MATVDELIVRITADTDQLRRELARAENATRRSGSRIQNAFKGVDARMKGLGRTVFNLKTAFLGLGLGLVGRQAVDLADRFKNMQARINIVSDSAEDAETAMAGLFETAQKTGTSFEAAAELFARVARSRQELGITTGELLQFTENLQKAIVISGASATEASAAIIQLGQGLASGTLRGDELRSVMEQLPIVARAIADEMGVNLGRFRELAAEGKVTADVVIGAVNGMTAEWGEQFNRMPVTVGRAMTKVQNEILKLVGAIDSGTDASKDLSAAISEVADVIGSKEFAEGATEFLTGLTSTVKFLVDNKEVFGAIVGALTGLRFGGIKGAAVGAAAGAAAFRTMADRIEEAQEKLKALGAEREALNKRTLEDLKANKDLSDQVIRNFGRMFDNLRSMGETSMRPLATINKEIAETERLLLQLMSGPQIVDDMFNIDDDRLKSFEDLRALFEQLHERRQLWADHEAAAKALGVSVEDAKKVFDALDGRMTTIIRKAEMMQAIAKKPTLLIGDEEFGGPPEPRVSEPKDSEKAAAFAKQLIFETEQLSRNSREQFINAMARKAIDKEASAAQVAQIRALAAALHDERTAIEQNATAREEAFDLFAKEAQAEAEREKAAVMRQLEAEKSIDVYSEETAQLRQQLEARKKSEVAMRVEAEVQKRLNDLKKDNIDITEEMTAQIRRQAEAREGIRKQIEDIEEAERRQAEAARDFTNVITKGFEDAIIKGESFKDVMNSLADDLQRIATRVLVTKPLENMLTDLLDPKGGTTSRQAFSLFRPRSPDASGTPTASPGDTGMTEEEFKRWNDLWGDTLNDGTDMTGETLGNYNKNLGETFDKMVGGIVNTGSKFLDGFGGALSGILGGLFQTNSTGSNLLRSAFAGVSSYFGGGLGISGPLTLTGPTSSGGVAALGSDVVGGFGPSFAKGGVMTARGPLPLQRYGSGGIANSPQLAMFGEGSRPEAYVPLPDGRRIPVQMKNDTPNVVVHQNLNFAVGVTDTVRAEIMSMMPTIQKSTVAAVVNQSRRDPRMLR